MINNNVKKIIAVAIVSAVSLIIFACEQSVGTAQTPTEAYKQLFNAVKSKNTENIKKMMSKDSNALIEMQSAQTKQPIEQVYANGLTATTMSSNLPQIRDERVKENFGAVEVWNEKDRKWDDVPFVKEDGVWKIAVGDIFAGTYEKPGDSQSFKEREAANTANPMKPMASVDTVNANVNMKVQQPPMPSKKDLGKEAEKK